MKLFIALALLSVLLTGANAGGVPTCAKQNDCITWEMTKLEPSTCGLGGDCTLKVCMTLDATASTCAKDVDAGETISHACDKADINGCPRNPSAWDSTTQVSCGLATGTGSLGADKCGDVSKTTFCSTGTPGATLEFAVKDASDTTTDSAVTTFNSFSFCGKPVVITCQQALAAGYAQTCSGTGNANKERVWKFTIPTDACTCGGGDGEEPLPCNPTFCEVCAYVCPPEPPCPVGCSSDVRPVEECPSRRMLSQNKRAASVVKPHWLRA